MTLQNPFLAQIYPPLSRQLSPYVVTSVSFSVQQAQVRFPEVSKAGPAALNVFKIINRKPLIDASSSEGAQLPVVKGDIKFSDVKFVYPSRPEVVVFKNFTFSIPAGKKVALVSCCLCGARLQHEGVESVGCSFCGMYNFGDIAVRSCTSEL